MKGVKKYLKRTANTIMFLKENDAPKFNINRWGIVRFFKYRWELSDFLNIEKNARTWSWLRARINLNFPGKRVWCHSFRNWPLDQCSWELWKNQGNRTGRKITPIHAEVHDLLFANEFFDIVICVDTYNYLGVEENYLSKYLAPL